MNYKKYHLLLLSCLSGLLLSLSWPKDGLSVLLFIAFIPFLMVERHIFIERSKYSRFAVFIYTYPGFFLWNLLTTWWIYYSTAVGAIFAIVFNSLFMTLFFQLFHSSRRIINKSYRKPYDTGYFILIVYWITYEFFHLNWELSWPWLQLGNGFASSVKIIQWYEFTGVLGGTLWILLLNIMFFKFMMLIAENGSKLQLRRHKIASLSLLLLPIIISCFIYYTYKEEKNPVDIVVIQPNVDPYVEKFSIKYTESIWEKLLNNSKLVGDSFVDYIVWPETAIPGSVFLGREYEPPAITRIKVFMKNHFPNTVLITGVDAYEVYDEKKTATARYSQDGDIYWDSFNSAFEIDSKDLRNYYHKSKLVPGVERMPYPQYFGFLEKYAIDLGGASGSLGTSPFPVVFSSGKFPVAVAICYESVFGEYMTKYINKNAQLIFIVTNDGWWRDTPGYRQHFSYASLRAVETRRSIARSANTGTSGFINQRGEIIESVPFWEEHAIRNTINANNRLTIYTKYGDYIGRLSAFASLVVIIIVIIKRLSPRKLLN